MPTHLVSNIDVQNFGGQTLRIGDLNGDGAPDLLFAQSTYGTREITCLTATTVLGEVLWQHGTPDGGNGRIYSDLPVQIYDWDNDGVNEVLYIRQAEYVKPILLAGWARENAEEYAGHATMVVLDATTGQEKTTFPLPAPADDSFLFADLTGSGRRQDLVVKDRYWNMWGVAHDATVLWHWEGATGHFPAVADIDGDGRDEVFVGFACIDHDGTVLYSHDPEDSHQDAAFIVRNGNGEWRMLFGNGGVHCLRADGSQLWHQPLEEAQHVVVGHFNSSSPLQVLAVNRGLDRSENGFSVVHLFDLETGEELWQRKQPAGSWAAIAAGIHWQGPGEPMCALVTRRGQGQPVVILNGNGEVVDSLPLEHADASPDNVNMVMHGVCADVWGDSRDEVILFRSQGAAVYANARPLAIPTLYNNTHYIGM